MIWAHYIISSNQVTTSQLFVLYYFSQYVNWSDLFIPGQYSKPRLGWCARFICVKGCETVLLWAWWEQPPTKQEATSWGEFFLLRQTIYLVQAMGLPCITTKTRISSTLDPLYVWNITMVKLDAVPDAPWKQPLKGSSHYHVSWK